MRKYTFILTLLITIIVLSATTLAITNVRQLNTTFNNIKIYVDGQLIEAKDALGRPVEPFIMDGSTYLPVRAVAEALGKDVEWDGPNQSVYIGRKPLDPNISRIAIITNTINQNEEEYRSAEEVVKKYGEDKVVHMTWPESFMQEQGQMIQLLEQISFDPQIKALIINQAVYGTLAAINKAKLFIRSPAAPPPIIASLLL
jgi:hypothetical protein